MFGLNKKDKMDNNSLLQQKKDDDYLKLINKYQKLRPPYENYKQHPSNMADIEIESLKGAVRSQNGIIQELKSCIEALAEHLMIEKAIKNGLDPIKVKQLFNSTVDGDRDIAIVLVNDAVLQKVLETIKSKTMWNSGYDSYVAANTAGI